MLSPVMSAKPAKMVRGLLLAGGRGAAGIQGAQIGGRLSHSLLKSSDLSLFGRKQDEYHRKLAQILFEMAS